MNIRWRIDRLCELARRQGLLVNVAPDDATAPSPAMTKLRSDPEAVAAMATVDKVLAEFGGQPLTPTTIRAAMNKLQSNPEAAAAMDLITQKLIEAEKPKP